MTNHLITILAGGTEKLNIELDATGLWTLRKNSTPKWRNYCAYPNGSWAEINGLFGKELCLYDATKKRCFSVLSWGQQTGKVQLVSTAGYGDWVFTSIPKNTHITFGIGFKAGGQAGVVGGEQAILMVYTPDQETFATPYGVTSVRLGAGKGASTGAIFATIRGFAATRDLHGFTIGNADYNLAMGPNFKKFIKGGAMAEIARSAETLKKMSGYLSQSQWETLATVVKDSASASEFLVESDEPSVSIYDLPWLGGGYEISAFLSAGLIYKADMAAFADFKTT